MMTSKEKREQAIQEINRKAIRDAVIQVMAQHGLDGLTMSRVAEQAEVAKGTIYQYYDNKEELMRDTINWCFMPLIEKAKEIFEMNIDPDKKLSKLLTAHHTFFSENQSLFKMLLVDHQINRAAAEKEGNGHYQEIIRRLAKLIQEGISQKIFKEVNPQAAAVILMESNMQYTCHILQSCDEKDLNPQKSASALQEIFFNGILTA